MDESDAGLINYIDTHKSMLPLCTKWPHPYNYGTIVYARYQDMMLHTNLLSFQFSFFLFYMPVYGIELQQRNTNSGKGGVRSLVLN